MSNPMASDAPRPIEVRCPGCDKSFDYQPREFKASKISCPPCGMSLLVIEPDDGEPIIEMFSYATQVLRDPSSVRSGPSSESSASTDSLATTLGSVTDDARNQISSFVKSEVAAIDEQMQAIRKLADKAQKSVKFAANNTEGQKSRIERNVQQIALTFTSQLEASHGKVLKQAVVKLKEELNDAVRSLYLRSAKKLLQETLDELKGLDNVRLHVDSLNKHVETKTTEVESGCNSLTERVEQQGEKFTEWLEEAIQRIQKLVVRHNKNVTDKFIELDQFTGGVQSRARQIDNAFSESLKGLERTRIQLEEQFDSHGNELSERLGTLNTEVANLTDRIYADAGRVEALASDRRLWKKRVDKNGAGDLSPQETQEIVEAAFDAALTPTVVKQLISQLAELQKRRDVCKDLPSLFDAIEDEYRKWTTIREQDNSETAAAVCEALEKIRRRADGWRLRHDIECFPNAGDEFSIALHERVSTRQDSTMEPDRIAETKRSGYRFQDGELLRRARVITSTLPDETTR